MSRKPDSEKAPGVLAEIRSFVFTIVVVALGIAFMTALFTGGLGSVQQLFDNVSSWFFQLTRNVFDAVTGLLPEPSP